MKIVYLLCCIIIAIALLLAANATNERSHVAGEFPTSGGALTMDNFGSGGVIGGPTAVQLDTIPDGELSPPSTVSRQSDGYSFSKADFLRTSGGSQVNKAENVAVRNSGSVLADRTSYFSYGSFSASNIVNLDFDAATETVSFDSADYVQVGEYYFHALGRSRFRSLGESFESAELTFPHDSTVYLLPNPLSDERDRVVSTMTRMPDSDNDGLVDEFEILNGLDPRNADTDGDGLTDFDEIMRFPTDALKIKTYEDATQPTDREFMAAAVEDPTIFGQTLHDVGLTRNLLRDRDGDGISDVNEVLYGTDYGAFDSDGDGLGDGQELGNNLDYLKKDLRATTAAACRDCIVAARGDAGGTLGLARRSNSMAFAQKNVTIGVGDGLNDVMRFESSKAGAESRARISKVSGGYDV